MVLLTASEDWQRQSSLLLQARPSTTRITTKYNVPNLDSAKYQNTKKRKANSEGYEKDASSSAPRIPKAILTLKTYDPESGVCLKFKTDRAADVGRLINGVGRLSRHMAALPQQTEDVVIQDRPGSANADTTDNAAPSQNNAAVADKASQPSTGSGAGKKKKKGKK